MGRPRFCWSNASLTKGDYMSFTLSDLQKIKKSQGGLEKLSSSMATKSYQDDDDGFFKLERDKAGNGSAVIRFLPKTDSDELPFVTIYDHAFQGPTGRWYIEKSLTTLGKPDPVSEDNRRLWASKSESSKNLARAHRRRTRWIANVLIISNPANPELEGKVMPYSMSKTIYDMIVDATKSDPMDEDKVPFNPFCPFTGAEFKLRIRQDDKFPSYDKSGFKSPSPMLGGDEEEILKVLNSMEPLAKFIEPERFKTYDELSAKFNSVMGTESASTQVSNIDDIPIAPPPVGKTAAEPEIPTASSPVQPTMDTDDDIESYFKSLT